MGTPKLSDDDLKIKQLIAQIEELEPIVQMEKDYYRQ